MSSRYCLSYCSKDFSITKSKVSVKYSWPSNCKSDWSRGSQVLQHIFEAVLCSRELNWSKQIALCVLQSLDDALITARWLVTNISPHFKDFRSGTKAPVIKDIKIY